MLSSIRVASLLFLMVCLPLSALAADSFFASPRAMGMGGANIVSVRDSSAQYYNPAAFGFFARQQEDGSPTPADKSDLGSRNWGLDISAAAGIRLHNDFGDYVDTLAEIDLSTLESNGIQTSSDLVDMVDLIEGLVGIDQPGTGLTADLSAAVAARYAHVGFGVRSYFQASSRVLNLDTVNLGIDLDIATINSQISSVTLTGNDGQVDLFSSGQVSQLLAAGFDAAAIQQLDFALRSNTLPTGDLQEVVDLLDTVGTQSSAGGGTLGDNTSVVALSGYAAGEIPLSYGYAFNDSLAIGGNLKLMRGRVYGTQLLVFDNSSGDLISESRNDYQETTTYGIDLGLMARSGKFAFGLVGRNLNSPEFDGFSKTTTLSNGQPWSFRVAKVRLDPQAAAGVAFYPFETLALELDLDLTSNETAFPGYDTRNLALGLEWNAFKVLALRAGVYRNLDEDDIKLVYTAGLGLNLWALRFDLAAAFAEKSFTYDGDDIPAESRVAASLSVDF